LMKILTISLFYLHERLKSKLWPSTNRSQ
jgi:hypothetical protein